MSTQHYSRKEGDTLLKKRMPTFLIIHERCCLLIIFFETQMKDSGVKLEKIIHHNLLFSFLSELYYDFHK